MSTSFTLLYESLKFHLAAVVQIAAMNSHASRAMPVDSLLVKFTSLPTLLVCSAGELSLFRKPVRRSAFQGTRGLRACCQGTHCGDGISCEPCEPGNYVQLDSWACLECSSRKVPSADKGSCQTCPGGKYLPTGSPASPAHPARMVSLAVIFALTAGVVDPPSKTVVVVTSGPLTDPRVSGSLAN